MSDIENIKEVSEALIQQHKTQRVLVGTIRKTSKKSAVWLLEGMSLSILCRAIKQFEADDIVMYELVTKARLTQEANLMIRHLLSAEAEKDASQTWGRAILYYIDRQKEVQYRQYKGKEIYNSIEENFFNLTSLWSHASYDNARTSFLYTNKDPLIYKLGHTHDNSTYDNMRWIEYIEKYTKSSFARVQEYLNEQQ